MAYDEIVPVTLKDENLYNTLVEMVKFTDDDERADKETKTIYILRSKLKNITEVTLIDKKIEYIDGVENLTELKTLNLISNSIEDITPISKLKNLEELFLTSNKIEKVDALKNLNKLEKLILNKNNIIINLGCE